MEVQEEMRLLYDLITVCRPTGAGEYVRRVLHELLQQKSCREGQLEVVGLYDSERGIAYDDLSVSSMEQRGVRMIDIHNKNVAELVRELKADHLFIGCAQFWWRYDGLADVKSNVTCVIHDLSYQEKWQNHIDEYTKLDKRQFWALCYSIGRLRRKKGSDHMMAPVIQLVERNPKAQIVVVSDYTQWSVIYQYPSLKDRIKVLYSPLRHLIWTATVENTQLRQLIDEGTDYCLLLGGKNPLKNGQKAIRAFMRYAKDGGKMHLLVVGGKTPSCPRLTVVPFLSDGDYEQALAHAHALLYPTYFEGFGYPPVEALKYGKPVLCSNLCSIPEVMGDAPIYFSPFYETDIYRALMLMDTSDYAQLQQWAKCRYEVIRERQETDLQTLLIRLTQQGDE